MSHTPVSGPISFEERWIRDMQDRCMTDLGCAVDLRRLLIAPAEEISHVLALTDVTIPQEQQSIKTYLESIRDSTITLFGAISSRDGNPATKKTVQVTVPAETDEAFPKESESADDGEEEAMSQACFSFEDSGYTDTSVFDKIGADLTGAVKVAWDRTVATIPTKELQLAAEVGDAFESLCKHLNKHFLAPNGKALVYEMSAKEDDYRLVTAPLATHIVRRFEDQDIDIYIVGSKQHPRQDVNRGYAMPSTSTIVMKQDIVWRDVDHQRKIATGDPVIMDKLRALYPTPAGYDAEVNFARWFCEHIPEQEQFPLMFRRGVIEEVRHVIDGIRLRRIAKPGATMKDALIRPGSQLEALSNVKLAEANADPDKVRHWNSTLTEISAQMTAAAACPQPGLVIREWLRNLRQSGDPRKYAQPHRGAADACVRLLSTLAQLKDAPKIGEKVSTNVLISAAERLAMLADREPNLMRLALKFVYGQQMRTAIDEPPFPPINSKGKLER